MLLFQQGKQPFHAWFYAVPIFCVTFVYIPFSALYLIQLEYILDLLGLNGPLDIDFVRYNQYWGGRVLHRLVFHNQLKLIFGHLHAHQVAGVDYED